MTGPKTGAPRQPPQATRLTLRTRLTLAIAAVFIPAGALAVIVQQAVFTNLVDTQFMYKVEQLRDHVPPTRPGSQPQDPDGDVQVGPPDQAGGPEDPGQDTLTTLSAPDLEGIDAAAEHVKTTATAWTAALTGLFAAAGALGAWLLAGRAFARVRQVTGFVRGLSPQTLGSRMALTGPGDEITELADTFDALLARLDDAFAARRRFVSNASHELRTPLATNRLGLQMAITRLEHGEDPARALEAALEANRSADRVLNALLALALVTETRPGAPVQTAPLAVIAETALAAASGPITAKRLHVQTHLDRIEAAASPDLVKIAVENLIDNAVKYSPPGGSLAVGLRGRGPTAELRITNTTANPIDQATADLLAEPFYRAQGAGHADQAPGLGLGLALVASIAGRFDGRLDLDASLPGQLTARLALPAARTTPET
jgi:signal transduction histidine kinase